MAHFSGTWSSDISGGAAYPPRIPSTSQFSYRGCVFVSFICAKKNQLFFFGGGGGVARRRVFFNVIFMLKHDRFFQDNWKLLSITLMADVGQTPF